MSRKQHAGKLMYGGHHAVLWKIPDFFSLLDKNRAYIVSPPFSHGNKTWCIELHFATLPQRACDTESFVCLTVTPKSPHYVQHFVYKCGIRKNGGGLYSSVDFTEFYLNAAYLLPVSEFFKHTDELAAKGTIILFAELRPHSQRSYFVNVHSAAASASRRDLSLDSLCSAQEERHLKCLNILSENLKDLYLKGQLCDVTFKLGDQDFHAHKAILASRSTVFADMVEVKEENGKVNVEDCDPDVFQKFLLYLYSGKANSLSTSDAVGLYTLSTKYKVDGLRPLCIDRMKKTLTIDNFCEIIELASKNNESDLLSYLKRYFIKSAKFILSTESWNSFIKEDTDLVTQLFLSVV